MPLTPWVAADDLPEDRPQPAADAWALACASASELLYQLTGRRFSGGGHPGRAVLERADVACAPSAGRRLGLVTDVRTDRPLKVRLPHRHVSEVQAVTSRGETVAPTLWRLESTQWLVDLTRAGWPRDGSLQVDYLYGAKPPPSGVTAAAILAHQLGLGLLGETEGCKLPSRVTAVTRQGITTSYRDAYDYLAAGNTGMYEVDLFITAHPRRVRTDVWSPELSALTLTAIPRSAP